MNENMVSVAGNLATDPERHTAVTGATFATFRVASTERGAARDGSGYEDRHTSFYRVIVWRTLAENALSTLKKGDPIVLSGRLRVSEFTRKDETPGTSVEIEAYHLGHDLALGTTVFTKGRRQPVVEGDRSTDPAVNAVRANGWGAPDPGADADCDPAIPDPPDFASFGSAEHEIDLPDDAGSPYAPAGSGAVSLI